ncbi:MurR/RpiR family transcriptional regulator [Streptomyces sp. NPDC001520]|uniref:MurR/RpiR family transcriptional regulator n=1 Tax=Streptomyces sp. NPDC001520 TaxID=3364581 RepID=UPI0036820359
MAATTTPGTFDELRLRLQELLPKLASGQRRIARLVLEDPEGTALRTIGESAELAGVHRSSLVRFATMLGFPGYPALVRLCREQLASEVQLVRRFEQAQQHGEAAELFAAIADDDTRNVARTFSQLDQGDWKRAVSAVAQAPAVHVLGLRKCYSVAYLAAYLLHMVRPRVRQLGTTSGLLVDELRDVAPGDVVVAASIRRYTVDTVKAIAHARAVGATTIALTDDPSSPLARIADLVFYVQTGSVTILRSLTAFTSLVQALATAVAVELGASSRDELATDEQLLNEFGLYSES